MFVPIIAHQIFTLKNLHNCMSNLFFQPEFALVIWVTLSQAAIFVACVT